MLLIDVDDDDVSVVFVVAFVSVCVCVCGLFICWCCFNGSSMEMCVGVCVRDQREGKEDER